MNIIGEGILIGPSIHITNNINIYLMCAGEFSHVYAGKLQKTVERACLSKVDSGLVSMSLKRGTVTQTIKVAIKTLKGNIKYK